MFLTKRRSGYYYLFFTDEYTGKRKGITTKTKQKSEALKFLTDFKGKQTKSPALNTVLYLDIFQDEVLKYTSSNLSEASNQIYKKVLTKLISIIGNKPLKLINIKDIEYYKDERLKEISKTTTNIEIRTLKAIFNLALKWGIIDNNPVKHVKQYSIPQKERLNFNAIELKILLANIKDNNFKNIVLFALYTGARISEIINVQKKDINMAERILTIKNKTNFRTKTGKNRQIPISNKLYELLKIMLNYKDGNILELNDPEQYIFSNPWGLPFNRKTISEKFKEILRKLKFPEKYHFHCLRYSFIMNLINQGVNINYVKEIAGHSSINTTMSYIHIVTEDLRDAMNKVSF